MSKKEKHQNGGVKDLRLLLSGLEKHEPDDFLNLLIDPNMIYCSETSPGSDGGVPEDPRSPASQAPSSPALYEVVYEAGALQGTQREAGPTFGLISIQIDQWSPAFMVPDACAVSGQPSDARRHILPRVGTGAPAPPTARNEAPVLRSRETLVREIGVLLKHLEEKRETPGKEMIQPRGRGRELGPKERALVCKQEDPSWEIRPQHPHHRLHIPLARMLCGPVGNSVSKED
ncbi:Cyclic AMP-responsive element-binding protein 3-like protein 4 [Apodemus speciosus]|uniref:Cyclic AMP-responsive element-binding protein 3-like protein 4 n=1 Tax=Apodemus speciosus TaxID=105296 RepID=A0ABQ0EL29_APOSI